MFGRKNPAVEIYKQAVKELHDNQEAEQAAGVTEETDTFNRLNAAVHTAEQDVPWWRR